jgi:hypothetical protein
VPTLATRSRSPGTTRRGAVRQRVHPAQRAAPAPCHPAGSRQIQPAPAVGSSPGVTIIFGFRTPHKFHCFSIDRAARIRKIPLFGQVTNSSSKLLKYRAVICCDHSRSVAKSVIFRSFRPGRPAQASRCQRAWRCASSELIMIRLNASGRSTFGKWRLRQSPRNGRREQDRRGSVSRSAASPAGVVAATVSFLKGVPDARITHCRLNPSFGQR